jgi:L-lactate dehydrogenase complex protein LldG
MDETTSKEKVFKSIRNALIDKTDSPYTDVDFESSVFLDFKESAEVTFAQEFTRIAGRFAYCEDEADMIEKLKFIIYENNNHGIFCFDQALKSLLSEHEIAFQSEPIALMNASIGLTLCECLIARTGSIMVSSRQMSGRRLNVFPEVHVVIASTDQLVNNLRDAFELMKKKYSGTLPSAITVISGPSRTADIEKTLVMGAHGPRQLYVLLVEAEEIN